MFESRHLPEYNIVVLPDFGQSLLPQRVYTAPPVTPPEFPFSPFTPLGPGSPRLPGVPAKWSIIIPLVPTSLKCALQCKTITAFLSSPPHQ